jgi:hypothetical protein
MAICFELLLGVVERFFSHQISLYNNLFVVLIEYCLSNQSDCHTHLSLVFPYSWPAKSHVT